MDLGIRVDKAPEPLPAISWRWDPATEILTGRFPVPDGRGLTGAVEFEDPEGAVVTVDVAQGTVCGVEIVVWPATERTEALAPPAAAEPGSVRVPARPSQPGIGAVVIEVPVLITATPGDDVIHVRLGAGGAVRTVQVADGLLVELNAHNGFAGFWLLNVPAFPKEAA